MRRSLGAIMTELIDYAGLFPPAELSMPAACELFVAHRESAASWMLGHFVCPASRLTELAAQARERGAARLRVSMLARPSGDGAAFVAAAMDAAGELQNWNRSDAPLVIGAIELRLPSDLLEDEVELRRALVTVVDRFPTEAGCEVFVEGTPARSARLAEALQHAGGGRLGLKLRTGGVTPDAVPSVEQVAECLIASAATGLPWKATAGLHHPLRHFDRAVGTTVHGFLNVFLAALFARSGRSSHAELIRLLSEDDPGAFRFDDEAAHWRDLRLSTVEIRAFRAHVRSFGSCSFDEPREDLVKLGQDPRTAS